MSFDFEKLEGYQKAKEYNNKIRGEFLGLAEIDRVSKDQLRRAALSILLNIAEGTSRFTDASKRNFYVISRGSVFETIALLDSLQFEKTISAEKYQQFYQKGEELSKMLYALIKRLEKAV